MMSPIDNLRINEIHRKTKEDMDWEYTGMKSHTTGQRTAASLRGQKRESIPIALINKKLNQLINDLGNFGSTTSCRREWWTGGATNELSIEFDGAATMSTRSNSMERHDNFKTYNTMNMNMNLINFTLLGF